MTEWMIALATGFTIAWMFTVLFRLGDIRDELKKLRAQGNRR